MPSCSAAAAVLLAILPNQNSAAAPGQKVQLRAVVRLAAHAAWVRSSPPTCTKSQPPPPPRLHPANRNTAGPSKQNHRNDEALSLNAVPRRSSLYYAIDHTIGKCGNVWSRKGFDTPTRRVARSGLRHRLWFELQQSTFLGEEFALAARFAPHACATQRRSKWAAEFWRERN